MKTTNENIKYSAVNGFFLLKSFADIKIKTMDAKNISGYQSINSLPLLFLCTGLPKCLKQGNKLKIESR
jgi:hypothetical protein